MTTDPRPAPPEHADRGRREALMKDAIIRYGNAREAGDMSCAAEIFVDDICVQLDSFARTPESETGTAEPVAWLPITKDGQPLWSNIYIQWEGLEPREAEAQARRGMEPRHTVHPLYLRPAPPPSVGAVPANELTGFEKGALDPDAIAAARKWLSAAERSDRYWHREHTTIKCALDRAAPSVGAVQDWRTSEKVRESLVWVHDGVASRGSGISLYKRLDALCDAVAKCTALPVGATPSPETNV